MNNYPMVEVRLEERGDEAWLDFLEWCGERDFIIYHNNLTPYRPSIFLRHAGLLRDACADTICVRIDNRHNDAALFRLMFC